MMKAGRELDVLVAEKVMGWVRLTDGELYGDRFDAVYPGADAAGFERSRMCTYWLDPAELNEYGEPERMCPIEDDDDYQFPTMGWRPSTSISAVWEVVEKMGKRCDDDMLMGYQLELRTYRGRVIARFLQSPPIEWMAKEHWDSTEDANAGLAETAPHAICLAALKAIDSE